MILQQQKPLLNSSFTADIRQAAAMIMKNSQYIKINEAAIPAYTDWLLEKYPLITEIDKGDHFVSEISDEQTAAYILALDSINFGSGYFHVAQAAGVDLEYRMIAGGLKQAFLQGRLNTPEKWVAATAVECHAVFNIPVGAHAALDQLMVLFAAHLNETGRRICNEWSGKVLHLISSANGSAVQLAATVAAWPTFADKPFYKRAQIFAADINLVLRDLAGFRDMDQLTVFADNMVSHVLRHDGILTYATDLSRRIDAGMTIEQGSAEEKELRAAAIHTVERMRATTGGRVTSVNLDHILWNRGYEPDVYAGKPHRTMTVWY